MSGVEEAIEVTNVVCDQPLALYVYSEDQSVVDQYVTTRRNPTPSPPQLDCQGNGVIDWSRVAAAGLLH